MLWNSITALLPRVFKSMYSLCVGMHFCACGRVFGTLFVFINNKVIRNCNLLAKRITAVITMARPQPQHNPTAPFQSQYQLNPPHRTTNPIHLVISMRVYLCRLAVFTGCILESWDPWFIVVPPTSQRASEHASGSSISVFVMISPHCMYIFSYTLYRFAVYFCFHYFLIWRFICPWLISMFFFYPNRRVFSHISCDEELY